jgi:DNA ligase-1
MASLIRTTLYSKGRKGETRFWQVSTQGDQIIVEHGVLGGVTSVSKRLALPKNIGRANETTGPQQAQLEAQAMWQHKRDRKYSLTVEDAQEDLALPMLALDLEKVIGKKGPKQKDPNSLFPADLQRKFDGNRSKARWNEEGTAVLLESRSGKLWTATPHINAALEKIMPKDAEFDGELYYHGWTLQKITSRAKKAHDDTHLLQFWIYDMPVIGGADDLPWHQRNNNLEHQASLWGHEESPSYGAIEWVETVTVFTYDEATALHDKWVQEGYEGAIIRRPDGVYDFGNRSRDLIKLKVFQDAEFQIIGFKAEEGQDEPLVVWECKNDTNDLTFHTRPKGTHEDRAILYRTADSYVGEMLTVRFFNRTPDGLPFLPIGHAVRPTEDMD